MNSPAGDLWILQSWCLEFGSDHTCWADLTSGFLPTKQLSYLLNTHACSYSTIMALIRPILRGLIRRQPSLARLHLSKYSPSQQQFHTTAITLMRPGLASTIPPLPATLSHQGVYTDSFPYTLHYYCSLGSKLALYDPTRLPSYIAYMEGRCDELENDPHFQRRNHVFADDNGLVDPTNPSQWNGVPMYPNTNFQLALMGNLEDLADEAREQGRDMPQSRVFSISRGKCCLRVLPVAKYHVFREGEPT